QALREAGARDGDTVVIGPLEFVLGDEEGNTGDRGNGGEDEEP
ncbi:MAG: hypothetical protein DIU69_04195, partial [Bacillota bacterium]